MKTFTKHERRLVEERIERAMESGGAYSHNIIGLALSRVADDYGDKAANELIEQYRLTRYGFRPLGQDIVQRWCGEKGREHVWKRERDIGQFCFRCTLLLTAFKARFPEARREQLAKARV
jgi:hypothetical protein